ncbi:hypothetical protein IMZ48_18445, partial [Candidatus Bathyarchaeota archaeon]|nr:hypothetical protein [Candidatus Bathyarchaeota archaeon]
MHKLGHFGVCLTDFAKAYEFYSTRFNLIASEVSPLSLPSAPHFSLTPVLYHP